MSKEPKKKKLIVIWLILLTIFVLWTHFVPQLYWAYHHLYVSVSSRYSTSFDEQCYLTPVLWFNWKGLDIMSNSSNVDYCEKIEYEK